MSGPKKQVFIKTTDGEKLFLLGIYPFITIYNNTTISELKSKLPKDLYHRCRSICFPMIMDELKFEDSNKKYLTFLKFQLKIAENLCLALEILPFSSLPTTTQPP
jgi:hypothetical protein